MVDNEHSLHVKAAARLKEAWRKSKPYHDSIASFVGEASKVIRLSPHIGARLGHVSTGISVAVAAYNLLDRVRSANSMSPWDFWEQDQIQDNYAMLHPYLERWATQLGIEAESVVCEDTYRGIIRGRIGDAFEAYWEVTQNNDLLAGEAKDIRVLKSDLGVLSDRVRALFWADFDGPITAQEGRMTLDRPLPSGLIETSNLRKVRRRVLPFMEDGETRSFMLVGPPGSGKSLVARQLLAGTKHSVIRLSAHSVDDLSRNDGGWLSKYATLESLAKATKPDVLILDDLDHTKADTQIKLLHALEELRGHVKWLLATVNNPARLKYALRRPERFDDVINVGAVGADEVMHVMGFLVPVAVDAWPIAYVNELHKRLDKMQIPRGSVEYQQEVADLDRRQAELRRAMLDEGSGKEEDDDYDELVGLG